MDIDVVVTFTNSAFKHGATEEDIRWIFETGRYDGPLKNEPGKRLLIGFNTKALPYEVMYNEIDEHTVRVFHAMPCQPKYLPLLQGEEQ